MELTQSPHAVLRGTSRKESTGVFAGCFPPLGHWHVLLTWGHLHLTGGRCDWGYFLHRHVEEKTAFLGRPVIMIVSGTRDQFLIMLSWEWGTKERKWEEKIPFLHGHLGLWGFYGAHDTIVARGCGEFLEGTFGPSVFLLACVGCGASAEPGFGPADGQCVRVACSPGARGRAEVRLSMSPGQGPGPAPWDRPQTLCGHRPRLCSQ